MRSNQPLPHEFNQQLSHLLSHLASYPSLPQLHPEAQLHLFSNFQTQLRLLPSPTLS